jgi:ATP-dependent helicase/nuclease subunit A
MDSSSFLFSSSSMTDQPIRDMLVSTFDRNFLVEASAGSGKTTILVERLVRMIAGGHAKLHQTAALTFTRKAAAEMRERFFLRLDQLAKENDDSRISKRLKEALDQRHQTYIGTIHGFCARLLHEYAAEAQLPPGFQEIDEEGEEDLRQQGWEAWVAHCDEEEETKSRGGKTRTQVDKETWRSRLGEVGLQVEDLRHEFDSLCTYSDITNWPAAEVACPEYRGLLKELAEYVAHMRSLSPQLVSNGKIPDKLMAMYRRLPRLGVPPVTSHPSEVFSYLERYRAIQKKDVKIALWPEKQGVSEWKRWNELCEKVAPLLHAWRAYRYPIVISFLKESAAYYERERYRLGTLTYQDLLLHAVKLVKNNHMVRKSISQQWKHLLVDEFQDTDPLQAELLFLITGQKRQGDKETGRQEGNEGDSNVLSARPGSLFLVGDPQQSIYRFRRADMAVYEQVKANWYVCGEVVHLTTNFRSQPSLIEWVNSTFTALFKTHSTPYQATFVSMEPPSDKLKEANARRVADTLCILPVTGQAKEEIAQREANAIAQLIDQMIEQDKQTRGREPADNGSPLCADDFLILTAYRNRLATYSQELFRWNIPHQITGGAGLNDFRGLRLIKLLMVAASQPGNEPALVGLLRSELVGLSDVELFEYQHGGGKFNWLSRPERSIPHFEAIGSLFLHLQTLASDLGRMSIIPALERTLIKLGVPIWSQAQDESGLGSLAATLIYLRRVESRTRTVRGVLAGLERLLSRELRRDGLFVPSQAGVGVRIMNLHKAKGLESRVVILADSAGYRPIPPPTLHVQRPSSASAGFLHLKRQVSSFQSTSLAHPQDWQRHEAEEMNYLQAERCRLLYVAATRARDLLVICSLEGRTGDPNRRNPWKELLRFVTKAKRLDIQVDTGNCGSDTSKLPPHQYNRYLRQRQPS